MVFGDPADIQFVQSVFPDQRLIAVYQADPDSCNKASVQCTGQDGCAFCIFMFLFWPILPIWCMFRGPQTCSIASTLAAQLYFVSETGIGKAQRQPGCNCCSSQAAGNLFVPWQNIVMIDSIVASGCATASSIAIREQLVRVGGGGAGNNHRDKWYLSSGQVDQIATFLRRCQQDFKQNMMPVMPQQVPFGYNPQQQPFGDFDKKGGSPPPYNPGLAQQQGPYQQMPPTGNQPPPPPMMMTPVDQYGNPINNPN